MNNERIGHEVIEHWYAFVDGHQFSAREFYDSIEAELAEREVPRLKATRPQFHEGSALSDKRVYLRLSRERFAFDICAAPFGTGYFFSFRFIEKPRGGWIQLLVMLAAISLVISSVSMVAQLALWKVVGFVLILCVLAVLGLWVASWAEPAPARATREVPKTGAMPASTDDIEPDEPVDPIILESLAAADEPANESDSGSVATEPATYRPIGKPPSTLPDLDSVLLAIPVFGEWYERHRSDTYFRRDTRLLYHGVVSSIVKRRAEEVAATKGVQLVRQYEYSPVLGAMYKKVPDGKSDLVVA